jgi:hypothetical protein
MSSSRESEQPTLQKKKSLREAKAEQAALLKRLDENKQRQCCLRETSASLEQQLAHEKNLEALVAERNASQEAFESAREALRQPGLKFELDTERILQMEPAERDAALDRMRAALRQLKKG